MLSKLDVKALSSLYKTSMTSDKPNTYTRGNFFLKLHDLTTDKWLGFSRKNIFKLTKYLNMADENYYTVNSIQGHKLSDDKVSNVVGYNGLFADLDISGHQGKTDVDKIKKVFKYIQEASSQHKILPYTYCVYTGHGLDLVWLFKCQLTDNSKGTALQQDWQALEDAILTSLSKDKVLSKYVDNKVHDASRVIRYPGTFNTKYILASSSDMLPLSAEVIDFTGHKYDFWKLFHKFVRVPKIAKVSHAYEQSTNARFVMKLSYSALNLRHRLQSVEHLVTLRHGKMKGYRNSCLHIIASGLLNINSAVRNYSINTQKDVKKYICKRIKLINQQFTVPLSAEEMQVLYDKVNASHFDTRSKSNDFAKYYYKKLSKTRRGGIIRFLDITPTEQWYLTYLRTPAVERAHRNWLNRLNRQAVRKSVRLSHREERKQAHLRHLKFIKHVIWYYKHTKKTEAQVAKHFGHKSGSWLSTLIKRYGHIDLQHTYPKTEYQTTPAGQKIGVIRGIIRLTG